MKIFQNVPVFGIDANRILFYNYLLDKLPYANSNALRPRKRSRPLPEWNKHYTPHPQGTEKPCLPL